MNTKANYIVRSACLLTIYTCCSSVVCCEASRPAAMQQPTSKHQHNGIINEQSPDGALTPVQLVTAHIMSFL